MSPGSDKIDLENKIQPRKNGSIMSSFFLFSWIPFKIKFSD